VRLLIHQALKDVRLLRWLLLAWVLALVVFHGVVVHVLSVPRPDAELLHAFDTIETILALAGTAAFIVIAVLLVQNDSPATTTTFWVTRPTSGRAMLASKLFTALLLLWALPIAGNVVDAAAAGIDIRSFPFSRFTFQLAWLLPLMAIAAITVGLPQFVLVAIIEFLLVAVFSSTAVSFGIWGASYTFDMFAWPLIALALVLLGYQYLTRQTTRAAVALGVAPLAVAGLAGLVSHAAPDLQASADRALQSISITADPRSIHTTDRGATTLFDVPLTLSGVPDGTSVSLGFEKAWLQIGAQRIHLQGLTGGSWPRAVTEEARQEGNRRLRPALAGATLLNPDPMGARRDHLTLIARTRDLQAAGAQPIAAHLEVRLAAWVYQPVATAPLRPGASFHATSMSGRVLDVQSDATRATIALREVQAYWNTPFAFMRYLLRNGRLKQAVFLSQAMPVWFGTGSQFATAMLPVSGTLHAWWSSLDVDWRRTPVTSASAWLDGAELVAIRVRPGERMTRTIEIRDLRLEASSQ